MLSLQPIEFKLHISLVLEISELLSSLNNLTAKLENIEKTDFIQTLNETSAIMDGSSKKIIAQDNTNEQYLAQKSSKGIELDKNLKTSEAPAQEPICSYIDVDYSQEFSAINPIKTKKTYVEHFKIKAISCFMTLRIRGIESILQKRNAMSVLLNLSSNFADITDAEFNFTEMEITKQ